MSRAPDRFFVRLGCGPEGRGFGGRARRNSLGCGGLRRGRAVKGRPEAEREPQRSGGSQRPLRARSVAGATMDEEARQGFLGAPLASW